MGKILWEIFQSQNERSFLMQWISALSDNISRIPHVKPGAKHGSGAKNQTSTRPSRPVRNYYAVSL